MNKKEKLAHEIAADHSHMYAYFLDHPCVMQEHFTWYAKAFNAENEADRRSYERQAVAVWMQSAEAIAEEIFEEEGMPEG